MLSLVPGVSRSGVIITASRFLNFDRIDSTKIAFYLSIPALAGASVLGISDLISDEIKFDFVFLLSILLSFIISYLVFFIDKKYFETSITLSIGGIFGAVGNRYFGSERRLRNKKVN